MEDSCNMKGWLSGLQNTKWTILFLSCFSGFIDECLMTIPVPILPNLFIAECQFDLLHEHRNMTGTRYTPDEPCSTELSAELKALCTQNDLELHLPDWKLVYLIDESNQTCKTAPTGYEATMFSPSDRPSLPLEYYEIPLTGEICLEWLECEKKVNIRIGVILSSKFLMRVLLSIPLTVLPKYVGFLPVYLVSLVVGIASCAVYALSTWFYLILTARLLHGVSATLLTIGMGGLTNYAFREDDHQRGIAIGTLISFMALGSVVGPPFGGSLYFLFGYQFPFIFIAVIYFFTLVLLMMCLTENSKDESVVQSSMFDIIELLLDPYILICTLGFTFAGCSVSIIESALPHWMITEMASPSWVQGVIYLPMAGIAVPCGILAGFAGKRISRWIMVLVGFLLIGAALVTIPLCQSPQVIILPMALLGAGFGLLDSTLSASICRFGQERHRGMYAASIVICGASFSFGFALGPAIMSALINFIGFRWLITGMGCLVLPFAFASFILRIGENSLSQKQNETSGNKSEKEKLLPGTSSSVDD